MNKTIQNTHSHKADITLLLGIIFIEVSAKTSVLVDDENTWNPVIFAALAQFGVPTARQKHYVKSNHSFREVCNNKITLED